jgi:parallel beta-helix repeat protein
MQILPGTDAQASIDASPEGATICFQPGLYRLEKPLNPKANQRLVGVQGVVLSGAKVVTGFTPAGPNFVATGFLPPTPSDHGQCKVPGCTYAQDVFLDGVRLSRALELSKLTKHTFYQDFKENQIYLPDDPSNRVVEQAYAPSIIASSNPGVIIEDLAIEKAAGEAQTAAVMTDAPGWLIQHNEARLNHGHGIHCGNCVVRNNFVHHNGQMGLSGDYGSHDLVQANEVAYNNTAGYDPLWEAGGTKWGYMTGLTVRGNYVHHNRGPGLWTDTNNKGTIVEGNYVSSNDDHGIFHEISFEAKIKNNIVVGNGFKSAGDMDGWGGVGIRIAESSNVEVFNNRLFGNRNGIVAVQQDRPDFPDPQGPHEVRHLFVHENEISMTEGVSGLVQDVGESRYFSDQENRFNYNHYHLNSMAAHRFTWHDEFTTAARWKGYGNDTKGSFDTSIPSPPDPPTLEVGPRSISPGAVP